MTYTPGHACMRCITTYRKLPRRHRQGTGPRRGRHAQRHAAEAIKYLTGCGKLGGYPLHVDLWIAPSKDSRERDNKCPCDKHPTIVTLYGSSAGGAVGEYGRVSLVI